MRCVPTLLSLSILALPAAAAQAPKVSVQGRLADAHGLPRRSPLGRLALEATPVGGDAHRLVWDLLLAPRDGAPRTLAGIEGTSFLPTDLDSIVVVASDHSGLSRVRVIDLEGRELLGRRVASLADPRLSADGRTLGFASSAGTEVVDLATGRTTLHPRLAPFALGIGGALAGVREDGAWVVRSAEGRERVLRERRAAGDGDERPRALAFAPGGTALWVARAHSLDLADLGTGRLVELARCEAPSEVTDLAAGAAGAIVGLRHRAAGRQWGEALVLDARGALVGASHSPVVAPPAAAIATVPLGSIPWPLAPAVQHPVGNTYGEFQDYGGEPYPHPGIDVLGSDGQPVHAARGGVVKAILTTSGQYHWRVAIADQGGSGTSEGYLYAHLDLPTIAVQVGDTVQAGDYLGDLVPWPVSGFTHCHFARIEESGSTWSGSWLCTENPHEDVWPRTESEPPVFEPARGSDLFAFCFDQTSTYLSPFGLEGRVDIVAHVGDRIASGWVCAVHELRYTIHPLGAPQSPVVDDRLAVRFDMALDTYQDGPNDPFLIELLYQEDGTCDTDGDYGSREFFHVVTNSDGDEDYEPSDLTEAWDTTQVPDGPYVIEVTAIDAAGNSATASMTVTVANGKP